jgi:hypothetical protein
LFFLPRPRADIVASFIAQEGQKAVFVGLYRRKEWRLVTKEQFWAIPAVAELKPFGVRGVEGRETCLWFELEATDICRELKGRLVVNWPPGMLWWRWANKKNNFPIHAIHEESVLDTKMPSWDKLSLSWEELRMMPTKLKNVLQGWRGIYYIFDVSIGKGYVGSACGEENILGRWLGYAASGHCGNKKLKELDPRNFLFTILQRTSPDMERDEVCQIEASWKDRLHTREYGLNDN